MTESISSGKILDISDQLIRPFYWRKAQAAVEQCKQKLQGVPFRIHKPEGAIFLWLWFEGLPITSEILYQRLKRRGVLVIPGQHFFPGLEDQGWRHRNECIRISYAQNTETVNHGIQIIAEEVKKAYTETPAGPVTLG